MVQNPKIVKLEEKIIQLILDKLRKNQLTLKKAQEIARFTLKKLKEDMSDEELIQIIPKLDDTYTELAPIVLEELNKYEKTTGTAVKEKVRRLIKTGQTDTATKLTKQYFKKDFS